MAPDQIWWWFLGRGVSKLAELDYSEMCEFRVSGKDLKEGGRGMRSWRWGGRHEEMRGGEGGRTGDERRGEGSGGVWERVGDSERQWQRGRRREGGEQRVLWRMKKDWVVVRKIGCHEQEKSGGGKIWKRIWLACWIGALDED